MMRIFSMFTAILSVHVRRYARLLLRLLLYCQSSLQSRYHQSEHRKVVGWKHRLEHTDELLTCCFWFLVKFSSIRIHTWRSPFSDIHALYRRSMKRSILMSKCTYSQRTSFFQMPTLTRATLNLHRFLSTALFSSSQLLTGQFHCSCVRSWDKWDRPEHTHL